MFVSMLITLLSSSCGRWQSSVNLARYLHAAILNLITHHDPSLGKVLHDMPRHKGITVALLPSTPYRLQWRLSFLDVDGLAYADIIVNSLAQNPTLRLNGNEYIVQDLRVDELPWTDIATWSDLTAPSEKRYLQFQFHSPTAITRYGTKTTRFTQLFPEPEYIFAGLSRRWQALSGPPLPDGLDDYITQGGCVVSSYDLYSTVFPTPERVQVAFLGTVTYYCLVDDQACIQALNNLTRFAFFAGVGYQTARGMGCVSTTLLERMTQL